MIPLGRISIRGERGQDRMTRLTTDEQYTLMTLWTIFRSPLMFGGDLPSNDEFTLELLSNEEVLYILKNSTNNRLLLSANDRKIWIADDSRSNDKFVAIFGITDDQPVNVVLDLESIGCHGTCMVRDLWTKKDLGEYSGELSLNVMKHGARLVKINPGPTDL
jgi:alpha-galactosidase